ncbi:MAG: GNAT family N-acetyltransferase [Anaerolineae bacterium]|nr:GNAT family N-acetyltransferase [Anaerolineae bacterium]
MEPIKTTYLLEMLDPGDLRAKRVDLPGLRVERVAIPFPEYNKFLHTVVGQAYRWGGRQAWTEEDWVSYARRDNLETWVATLDGTPAGYFEIEKEPGGAVHIHNFGLLPQFIGRGLGGHLLTVAVERAWAWGATRIWLSTCSHDHPHALDNYLARGFQIAETRTGPANPPLPSFWERMGGGDGTRA